MSREYLCSRITSGGTDHYGVRALCRVANTITDHETAATGSYVPQGHRLRTSPVVKVEVTKDTIAIITESGSRYWMPNAEEAEPIELHDSDAIHEWLEDRGLDVNPVSIAVRVALD